MSGTFLVKLVLDYHNRLHFVVVAVMNYFVLPVS